VSNNFTEDDRTTSELVSAMISIKLHQTLEFEEVEEEARTDRLTGLPNRHYFIKRLEEEMERVKRYDQDLSLCILDLDHFKEINDTYGHLTGDKVLKVVSDKLENIRTSDMAARYGGEEFALMFPETSVEDTEDLLQRIRHSVREYSFEDPSGNEFQVTCSFGVAEMNGHEESPDDLIEKADNAMYEAKNNGRDQIKFHQPA
jgi:diguanylate cyclase (GGDEF)-like protein